MKYEPKKKWLFNVPVAGVVYIAILGMKFGWDTEIDCDLDEDNSPYLGLSTSAVIFISFILILNLLS